MSSLLGFFRSRLNLSIPSPPREVRQAHLQPNHSFLTIVRLQQDNPISTSHSPESYDKLAMESVAEAVEDALESERASKLCLIEGYRREKGKREEAEKIAEARSSNQSKVQAVALESPSIQELKR